MNKVFNTEALKNKIAEGVAEGTINVRKGLNESIKAIERKMNGFILIANDLFRKYLEEVITTSAQKGEYYYNNTQYTKYELRELCQTRNMPKCSALFIVLGVRTKDFLDKVQ